MAKRTNGNGQQMVKAQSKREIALAFDADAFLVANGVSQTNFETSSGKTLRLEGYAPAEDGAVADLAIAQSEDVVIRTRRTGTLGGGKHRNQFTVKPEIAGELIVRDADKHIAQTALDGEITRDEPADKPEGDEAPQRDVINA